MIFTQYIERVTSRKRKNRLV